MLIVLPPSLIVPVEPGIGSAQSSSSKNASWYYYVDSNLVVSESCGRHGSSDSAGKSVELVVCW